MNYLKNQKKLIKELIDQEGFDCALLVHHDARYISDPEFSSLLSQLELVSFDLSNIFQFNYPEYYSEIKTYGLYDFIVGGDFSIYNLKLSRLIKVYRDLVDKIERFLDE